MPNKRFKSKQIVMLLRQLEVSMADGRKATLQVRRKAKEL